MDVELLASGIIVIVVGIGGWILAQSIKKSHESITKKLDYIAKQLIDKKYR